MNDFDNQASIVRLKMLANELGQAIEERAITSEVYNVCVAECESHFIEESGGIKAIGSNEAERNRNLLLHTANDDDVIRRLRQKIIAEAKYRELLILIDAVKLQAQMEIASINNDTSNN